MNNNESSVDVTIENEYRIDSGFYKSP